MCRGEYTDPCSCPESIILSGKRYIDKIYLLTGISCATSEENFIREDSNNFKISCPNLTTTSCFNFIEVLYKNGMRDTIWIDSFTKDPGNCRKYKNIFYHTSIKTYENDSIVWN